MAIDPSIPLAGLRAPRRLQTPFEIEAQAGEIEGNRMRNRLAQFQIQQAQQQQAQEEALRQAVAQGNGDFNAIAQNLLKGGHLGPAMKIKEWETKQSTEAAQAEKAQREAVRLRIQDGARLLVGAKDPESYRVARETAIRRGHAKPDEWPEQYDPAFVQGEVAQAQTVSELLAQGKPLTEIGKLLEDSKRGLIPKDVAQARIGVMTTHAPAASVRIGDISLNTEKKYGEQFSNKIADYDIALMESAQKSPQIIDRARRVRSLLDSGKVYTGTGADYKLQFGKAAKAIGLDYAGDDISNTERLAADLGQGTLDAIKASGLGAGQGFTNTDREFLQKVVTGDIKYDEKTLRRTAELAEKAAKSSIMRWNDRAQTIPKSAVEGTGVNISPIQIPDDIPPPQQQAQDEKAPVQIKSDAEFNVLPSGTLFIGPDRIKRRKP